MSLRKSAFSGVRWTAFSAFAIAVFQVLQILILARLLNPEAFGIFAIVISIIAILQIFSDAGVSNAIIHFQDVSQSKLSSLYWLNICVSAILAMLVVSICPWAASFFGAPELVPLLLIAAITLVINAAGQQIRVVAQKNLRFPTLAKVEVATALVGFFAAVGVAALGGGVYALIAGSLTRACVGTLLVWIILSDGWRPQYVFKFGEIREFLNFGKFMMGDNLFGVVNAQLDILIGGRMFTSQSLGFYSLSKDLNLRIVSIINPIITRVGLPVMAKVQADPRKLKSIYLKTMRMTASVNFPVYTFVGLFAPEIVELFLGDQWQKSIPLIRTLTFWALLRSIGNPAGSLLMALGRLDLSFKFNLMWFCIMLPVVWFGSQYGAQTLASAITVLAVIGYLPSWYFLVRPLCGAKLGEYSVQLAIPFVLSIAAGTIGYMVSEVFVSAFFRLIFGCGVSASIYLILSYFINYQWFQAMSELVGIQKE